MSRVDAADIRPIAPAAQTQSALDLFLIFVGANVVATTFQVGASLAGSFTLRTILVLVAVGSVAGAALVAALAPLGPRLRVPSVIAARPVLGFGGAGLVAAVLYISNFAWIALNNVIAASACARLGAAWIGPAAGSPPPGRSCSASWRPRSSGCGPRAVARADRVAVPAMVLVAIALTIACVARPATPASSHRRRRSAGGTASTSSSVIRSRGF